MAHTCSPTVIQQLIPVPHMTPLECLVLSFIFDAEPDGETLYFHTACGPSDANWLSTATRSEFVEAIEAGVEHQFSGH